MKGNEGSALLNPTMKYSLCICVALSARFCLWLWGGASWTLNYSLFSSKYICSCDISLLSLINADSYPFCLILVNNFVKAVYSGSVFLVEIAASRIALLSQSCIIKK